MIRERHSFSPTPGDALTRLLDGGAGATTPERLWASGLLPFGRSMIYEECNRFLASNGREGIPCIRVGERKIIIPIGALERWLGLETLTGTLGASE